MRGCSVGGFGLDLGFIRIFLGVLRRRIGEDKIGDRFGDWCDRFCVMEMIVFIMGFVCFWLF